MCKCFQTCLESCYWHLCEKWWCYDKGIEEWEDPEIAAAEKGPKRVASTDNMCFWDSVSVLAGRSVVTIQPLGTSDRAAQQRLIERKIVQRPEDEDIALKQKHLEKQLHNQLDSIKETENNNYVNSGFNNQPIDEVDSSINSIQNKSAYEYNKNGIKYIYDEKYSNSLPTINTNKDKELKCDVKEVILEPNNLDDYTEIMTPANSPMIESSQSSSFPRLDLDLNNSFELRLIKQASVPNFYIGTPDLSETPLRTPEPVMMSPMPFGREFNYDLRSIVEMERQKSREATPSPVGKHMTSMHTSRRLIAVRKKLAPLTIKRSGSNLKLQSVKA